MWAKVGEGTLPILDPQCRQEFLGALVPLWITFCHLFGLILTPLGSPLGSNLGAPGPRFCTLEPNLGTPGPVLGSTWGTLGLQSHQLRANLTSRTFNFEPTGSPNPPIRDQLGPSDSNFCKNSTPNQLFDLFFAPKIINFVNFLEFPLYFLYKCKGNPCLSGDVRVCPLTNLRL